MKSYVKKDGSILNEHDKLACGNGYDTWETHVQFDADVNRWHREQDYEQGILIGNYSV